MRIGTAPFLKKKNNNNWNDWLAVFSCVSQVWSLSGRWTTCQTPKTALSSSISWEGEESLKNWRGKRSKVLTTDAAVQHAIETRPGFEYYSKSFLILCLYLIEFACRDGTNKKSQKYRPCPHWHFRQSKANAQHIWKISSSFLNQVWREYTAPVPMPLVMLGSGWLSLIMTINEIHIQAATHWDAHITSVSRVGIKVDGSYTWSNKPKYLQLTPELSLAALLSVLTGRLTSSKGDRALMLMSGNDKART